MERSAVAITPPPFNEISQPGRFPTRSPLKDVSFSASSFLGQDRPNAPFDPTTSRLPRRMVVSAEDTELSIFDAEKYFNETSEQKQLPTLQPLSHLERAADKYELERASSVCSSADGYGRNFRNAVATPTASSEASWNSQSGLLTNPPGTMAVSMSKNMRLDDGKKGTSAPRRWFFRRKCPCSGNKSVDVKDKYSPSRNQIAHTNNSSDLKGNVLGDHLRKQSVEAKEDLPTTAKVRVSAQSWGKDQEQLAGSSRSTFTNELSRKVAFSARSVPFVADVGGFKFPVMNTQSSTIADSAMRAPVNSPEDPPRVSLEVFRPPLQPADHEEITFARKDMLPIYPGDVGRRSFSFAPSPRRRMEDDVASDSSSDLFELESFSTSTVTSAAPIYRRRDSLDELVRFGGGPQMYRRSLDEMSAAVRSAELAGVLEAYEPSEASVEWSVVTADAFDKTSVANFSASASDFGDHTTRTLTSTPALHDHKVEGDGIVGKKKGTAAGGGLLSCRWEKAVSVGPHPVKAVGGVLMSTSAYNQSHVVEQSGAFRVGMARVAAANVVGGGGGSFMHQHHRNGAGSNFNSSFSARPPPRAFLHR